MGMLDNWEKTMDESDDIALEVFHYTRLADKYLRMLNERRRYILLCRFGLQGFKESTLEEVGVEVGLSRERVRAIQMDALERLRSIMEDKGIKAETIFY